MTIVVPSSCPIWDMETAFSSQRISMSQRTSSISERHPRDSALGLLSGVGPQIDQRARRAAMADMVLNRVQVMSFLPKQNADAVLQNMVVPLCRVNAGQGRISLEDCIGILT